MIYIAGSFSNELERAQLEKLISIVQKEHPNTELFIPMKGFIPGGNDKDENGNYIMPNYIWARAVFTMDVEALDKCDEIIALYRGRYSGTGTAWEIGYAYAKGKPITIYIPEGVDKTSLMVINSAAKVISESEFEQK